MTVLQKLELLKKCVTLFCNDERLGVATCPRENSALHLFEYNELCWGTHVDWAIKNHKTSQYFGPNILVYLNNIWDHVKIYRDRA